MKKSFVAETVAEASDASAGLDAFAIADLGESLLHVDCDGADAERIAQIRALEQVKAKAAATQVQIEIDFAASQRRKQAAAGVPLAQRGLGVGAQIAMARQDSPHKGARHVGFAEALREMPHVKAAMRAGQVSEWRATLVVRETACLKLGDRQHIDQTIAANPSQLDGLGDQALVAKVKKLAAELDPASVAARTRRAVAQRHVSCRPAPDTMCYLTALLPVGQGVAAYTALVKAAASALAPGDARGRGQIMVDTFVMRLTGQTAATDVPVEVDLVIRARSAAATRALTSTGTVRAPQAWPANSLPMPPMPRSPRCAASPAGRSATRESISFARGRSR